MSLVLCTAASRGGDDAALGERIDRLVSRLDDDDAGERDKAEKELVALALENNGERAEGLLSSLPAAETSAPAEVRRRVDRIRDTVRARVAEQAVAATHVTLDLSDAPLADALEQIEKQTGNRLVDYRKRFGQDDPPKRVSMHADNQPFWPAVDKLLDAAGMAPYPFSGEEALALIDRQPGELARSGRAAYSGPFRIEATRATAERELRVSGRSSLQLELEVSWEPRLHPIAITQRAADFHATSDDGSDVAPTSPEAAFDVEVQPGAHAAEATIPLELPSRKATRLKTVRAKAMALVPARTVELKFDKLAEANQVSQQAGGVTVTLERVAKNQALWEVHMRIRVDSLKEGLETHRGWVLQNVTFLRDRDGKTIDHAGYETTSEGPREAGFAYYFELPDDISNYTWVYRTPAAIVDVPVEYELRDVPLP